jgi:ACS family tartrate transporter-like MFS transporter
VYHGRPMPTPHGELRSAALDAAVRKAMWRLMPLVFISYAIAYINRSNVSIAGNLMTKDLAGFTMAVFGDGSGIFFLGYVVLEIPGSLIVEKWSARKWITRIMVTWGIIAAATAAVKTPGQFLAIRFLLGLAEAGFFPGVIVFLTHWFPRKARARAISLFMVAQPLATSSVLISARLGLIGTDELVNGALVHHPLVLGLKGWQWIYIAWGIPAVLLGIAVYFWLTDRPSQARWLSDEERRALESALAAEGAESGGHMSVFKAINPRVILLALVYFLAITAAYGVEFFLPTVFESWYGLSLKSSSVLVVVPPALAFLLLLLAGWSSDRYKERRFHAALPMLIGGVFLILTPFTQGKLPLTVVFFTLAWAGFKAYLPAFWSLPNTFLTASAAAASIGFINMIGNVGGFVGPKLLGWYKTTTGAFTGGLYFLGAAMLLGSAVVFAVASARPRAAVSPEQELPQANSSAGTT